MFSSDLIKEINKQYHLNLWGPHGVTHWARVLENGQRLAKITGANIKVVALFAIFHDSNRINDGYDPAHGQRGAKFAEGLRGNLFELSDVDFNLLNIACAFHTDGLTTGDLTVMACWDADRLDLPRVGILIDPKRLCTDAAKGTELMNWADKRGRSRYTPAMVFNEWGLNK